MNKGHFIIICDNRDQAIAVRQGLGDMARYVRETSINVLDYPIANLHHDTIAWRKNPDIDKLPVLVKRNSVRDSVLEWKRIINDARVLDSGLILCLSASDTADSVRSTLREWLFDRNKQVIQAYRQLREQYPRCVFHLYKDNSYQYRIRMDDPSVEYVPPSMGIDPFNVPHANIMGQVARAAIADDLGSAYPNLYFYISDDGKYETVHVYTLRMVNGKRKDAAAAGLQFTLPVSDVVAQRLTEINHQAGIARNQDYFYCTHCQQAKPIGEFGGFYFAEQRCNECADPAWRKRAADEDYN